MPVRLRRHIKYQESVQVLSLNFNLPMSREREVRSNSLGLWYRLQGLNLGPSRYQHDALPTELSLYRQGGKIMEPHLAKHLL